MGGFLFRRSGRTFHGLLQFWNNPNKLWELRRCHARGQDEPWGKWTEKVKTYLCLHLILILMKPISLLLILPCLLSNPAPAQVINRDSAYIVNHYTKMERLIPMRDGVKLFTAIYLPRDQSEKHPILMLRTPYSCDVYGENRFTERWWTRGDSVYFYRNYIMVMQDVRGRFMSEGSYEDVRPFGAGNNSATDTDEASDTYDTIDWLIKNIPGNNGNVGVYGISYPGFYATMAALSNHPALKAVSPQAPVTDWFMGDDFHHHGAFALADGFNFYRIFGLPRSGPTRDWPKRPELKSSDNYSFFLENGTFAEIKKKYFGDTIRFWNDVQAHPDYDDWWKERDARRACKNIGPAVMITGGLFDAEDCFGAWNLYKAMEKQNPSASIRIVNGPWWHGGWARSTGERVGNSWFGEGQSAYYYKNAELPFFDYYLKGVGSAENLPEAAIFITGENTWNRFSQWPPKYIQPATLYLDENGKAGFRKPERIKSFDSYVSDPLKPVPYTEDVHFKRTREYMTDDQRFASRRPDVLVFQTDVLTKDLTVTGPVTADLFVSLSTTDADFVVKLIDVFPDDFKYPDSAGVHYPMGGYQMLVRGEIMRGRYRNSFEKPEPFVPGAVTQVKYELPDIAHTFKKGHRLMVQVQSTWFPLFDRNPQQFVNPYTCGSRDLVKSEIRLYHDAEHPSSIQFPVFNK